jgi:hypothetical protein
VKALVDIRTSLAEAFPAPLTQNVSLEQKFFVVGNNTPIVDIEVERRTSQKFEHIR